MTVITLSRQLGSHGDDIAAGVAARLKLRLIDAATISRAAQQAGVPSPALAEMEHEGERGLASQVLKALNTMPSFTSPPEPGGSATQAPGTPLPFAGLFSPLARPLSASLDDHVRMVGLVVQALAREGDVLVVGRGGQVLLRKQPDAFHVQIVAPFLSRVKELMTREGLDKRAAQNRVRANDRARADYLRRYHDVDWLDPTLYHLVINSGCLSVKVAVDLIVMAYQASTGVAEPNAGK
jgi:hypothetical protein